MTTKRNWPAEIRSNSDAFVWFLTLLIEDGVNVHPDTQVDDYVDAKGAPTFNAVEKKWFATLMGECFSVCIDVYQTNLEAFSAYGEAQRFNTGGGAVLLNWEDTTTPVAERLQADEAAELTVALNRAMLTSLLRRARQENEVPRAEVAAAPEFEQCPDVILKHLKAPAGWSWEDEVPAWTFESTTHQYILGNANGYISVDIYDATGENLEDGKNFATIAAALTFMQEVARG